MNHYRPVAVGTKSKSPMWKIQNVVTHTKVLEEDLNLALTQTVSQSKANRIYRRYNQS